MISEQFYQEIEDYSKIFITVSGGMDSTYTALEFYKRGLNATLVHNNTFLNMKESKQTIKKLREYTGYPYIELKPPLEEVSRIQEAFLAIPKAQQMKENGKYTKTVFKCCYYLKEKPFRTFLKGYPEAIVITSIRPGEGRNRAFWLKKIREENTYIHYKKKWKIMIGYPLRDMKVQEIRDYFKKIEWDVKHSGCKKCPILLLFNMFKQEPKRYLASKRYLLSLTNKPCIQMQESLT